MNQKLKKLSSIKEELEPKTESRAVNDVTMVTEEFEDDQQSPATVATASYSDSDKPAQLFDAFDISFWHSSCFSILPAPEFDNLDSIFENTDITNMILLD